MTRDTALQAANILYDLEECERIADELSNISSKNSKLSQIIADAISASNCYKDELNRRLDEL